MDRYSTALTKILAEGGSLEEALSQLKHMGATPVEVIKTIRLTQGINLGEAKQVFCASAAWAYEVAEGDKMHQEVISAVSKEQ